MQSATSENADNGMDRAFQMRSTSVVNHPAQQTGTRLSQSENNSCYQRYIPHNNLEQQREQLQQHPQDRHQVKQTGPVSFGIYPPLQQETSAPTSLPMSPTSSSATVAAPTRFVVTEETTTVKVPMLRPRPALLKVLHLSGGVGETYTMGEVINHVKEYIRERTLYDEQDPRVVHCGGDLLGQALGVDTFTVHEAIELFHKNCTMEPDSCIRIHRHFVTRAVNSQESASPGGGAASITTTAPPTRTVTTAPVPSSASVLHPPTRQLNQTDDLHTNTSQTPEATGTQTASIPSSLQSSKGPNLLLASPGSLSSSLPSSSSSSSSAVIKFKAAQSYVTVADSDLEKSDEEETASSSDSSDEDGRRHRFRGQHRRRGSEQSDVQKRTRSTSINVTYDEPDGAAGPWTCEVMMETSAGEMAKPEDDTVVVEFDSDAFSVEYDLESDSDSDFKGSKPAEHTCMESDESSSPSTAAILVVCKESDVEYLADYSDSDNGSNPELSDADKWECEHCQKKNPPFHRNCGGCWSIRRDWLPTTSKETAEDGATYVKQGTNMTVLSSYDSSQPQSQEISKESLESSQEQKSNKGTFSQSICQGDKNSKSVQHRKRKMSSSLSTSDSQDGKTNEKTEKIKESTEISPSNDSKTEMGKATNILSGKDDPCVVCLIRKKTASIIHGKTGHQVCCYRCARRLKEQRKSCPICRRPIQKVIRNFHL